MATTLSHQVKSIINHLDHGYLVDQDFQASSRWSIYWVFLSLLRPFYALAGRDVFSHLRVHTVAESIFKRCQDQPSELTPELKSWIKRDIFDRLSRKTDKKYDKALGETWCKIEALSSLPTPSIGKLGWPNDPRIKLTAEEQKQILSKIEGIGGLDPTTVIRANQEPLNLPVTVVAHYHSAIKNYHFYALLDEKQGTLLGDGGQRKVLLCVNLTTQQLQAYKPIFEEEHRVLRRLVLKKHYEGIPDIQCFFQIGSQNFIIERLYEGTVYHLLGSPYLNSLRNKMPIFHQLISAVSAMHSLEPKVEKDVIYYPFHQDITPVNILVDKGGQVALTDYGSACFLPGVSLCEGYIAPEVVTDYLSVTKRDSAFIADFNRRTGQSRDLWLLGKTFADILANSKTPLPSIREKFKRSEVTIQEVNKKEEKPDEIDDWTLLGDVPTVRQAAPAEKRTVIHYEFNITQGDIDQDIKTIKSSLTGPDRYVLEQLWDLVALLLKVKPEQRASIQEIQQVWSRISAQIY